MWILKMFLWTCSWNYYWWWFTVGNQSTSWPIRAENPQQCCSVNAFRLLKTQHYWQVHYINEEAFDLATWHLAKTLSNYCGQLRLLRFTKEAKNGTYCCATLYKIHTQRFPCSHRTQLREAASSPRCPPGLRWHTQTGGRTPPRYCRRCRPEIQHTNSVWVAVLQRTYLIKETVCNKMYVIKNESWVKNIFPYSIIWFGIECSVIVIWTEGTKMHWGWTLYVTLCI